MTEYRPNLIRFAEAITRYQLSRSTFDKASNEGHITKHKRNRAVFLDTLEIDAWLMGESKSA